MKRFRRPLIVLIIIASVAALAGLLFFLYVKGTFLPKWATFSDREFSAYEMDFKLTGRRLKVTLGDETAYDSGRDIIVQDCFLCDVDRDGTDELAVLCWKRGRYGSKRPFFVKNDPQVFSQHLYLYTLIGGKVKPMWMASNTGVDISFAKEDRNGCIKVTGKDGEESLWQWVSWGLARIR